MTFTFIIQNKSSNWDNQNSETGAWVSAVAAVSLTPALQTVTVSLNTFHYIKPSSCIFFVLLASWPRPTHLEIDQWNSDCCWYYNCVIEGHIAL